MLKRWKATLPTVSKAISVAGSRGYVHPTELVIVSTCDVLRVREEEFSGTVVYMQLCKRDVLIQRSILDQNRVLQGGRAFVGFARKFLSCTLALLIKRKLNICIVHIIYYLKKEIT